MTRDAAEEALARIRRPYATGPLVSIERQRVGAFGFAPETFFECLLELAGANA